VQQPSKRTLRSRPQSCPPPPPRANSRENRGGPQSKRAGPGGGRRPGLAPPAAVSDIVVTPATITCRAAASSVSQLRSAPRPLSDLKYWIRAAVPRLAKVDASRLSKKPDAVSPASVNAPVGNSEVPVSTSTRRRSAQYPARSWLFDPRFTPRSTRPP